jgi:hypothetical protein
VSPAVDLSPRRQDRPYAAWPRNRREPQLRVFQLSPGRLRLDFSGDVDQWSVPLLAAAEGAVAAAPRAEVLVDLGEVSVLHDLALVTFSRLRDTAAAFRFTAVSDAAARTFDLHRFEY